MENNLNQKQMSNSSKVYALFYSFFLIPLMITIFGVLFFFLFKMLTYEKQDPYHLLNNISSGSLTKRWQSAYELSNLMRDTTKVPKDQLFSSQMITMYQKAIHDDPRIRTYLALAMGQTQNNVFCEYLEAGISDQILENKIAAIKSVGMIGCEQCVDKLNNIIISDNQNQIRLAAIISVGQMLNKSSIDFLKVALDDEEPNIRWDSAVSLAKLNDNSGFYILKRLLDREYYQNYAEVDENEVNNTILTILALISRIESDKFQNELDILAKSEKNIKIREFAMKILSEYY